MYNESLSIKSDDEEASYSVKVYVYDLSHGMAAVYSPLLLGISIDAIYHTSVVVYKKEHYIDQGIRVCSSPGSTKYGIPREVIDMGETYISPEIFNEFLDELRNHDEGKYLPMNYDLFNNNCNHFTDVLLDFLVGKNLEERILNLPEQVLNSPNGHLLKQMIGSGQIV